MDFTSILEDTSKKEDFVSLDLYRKDPETDTTPIDGVLAEFYASALDTPVSEVKKDFDSGMKSYVHAEATRKAIELDNVRLSTVYNRVIEENVKNNVPPEEIDIESLRKSLTLGEHVSPDIAVLLSDSDLGNVERKYLERAIWADRLIQMKRAKTGEGFLNNLGYFADTMVSSGVHNVADFFIPGDVGLEGGGTLVKLAQEANALLLMNIPEDEFTQKFNEILDRVADAGFFSEENSFYLESFIGMMAEGGYGSASAIEGALQITDVALAGLPLFSKIVRGAATAAKSGKVLSTIGNVEKAADTIVAGASIENTGALAANSSPRMLSPGQFEFPLSGPDLMVMREMELNNSSLNIMKDEHWGAFVDPKVFAEVKSKLMSDLTAKVKAYKGREVNLDIRTDDFGNIYQTAYLGKRGGVPWTTETAAKKYADSIGGEVVPTIHEGKQAWIVAKEWNVPTEGLANATDINGIAESSLSKMFSTTLRTTPYNDALIKQAEAIKAKVTKNYSEALNSTVRKVKTEEFNNIEELFRLVRDDPSYNYRTQPITTDEFKRIYRELYQKDPTPEGTAYFELATEINDVDYFINADRILKEAVNDGQEMVQVDNGWYLSRKVDNTTLEPDDTVWIDGKFKLVSDLDLNKAVIHEIKDASFNPGDQGRVRYVATNGRAGLTTRRLYHTDVLPYNAGGHRMYLDKIEYFIKQETDPLTLRGGKKYSSKPTTFMGVRTREQALKVEGEWNAIASAVKDGASRVEIDRIIQNNNTWNTSIENLDDFVKFAEDNGLDPTKPVSKANDGEVLATQSTWKGEETVGQSFRNFFNNAKKRGDTPLIGFGGEQLETVSPIKAIRRGFSQSLARRADANYAFNATTGLQKAAAEARKAGDTVLRNADQLNGLSLRAWLEKAEWNTKNPIGKRLANEASLIKFKLSNTSSENALSLGISKSMAEYAFNKDWKKLGRFFDWMDSADPAKYLRAIAFNTKLGLFAVKQIWTQASQALNSLAISSATIGVPSALRATAGTIPLRMILMDIHPNVRKFIAQAQSIVTGISADDFIAVADWMKATGRSIVDHTVIEENNAPSLLNSGTNRLIDYGQVFFKEGELSARISAALLNIKEIRKSRPTATLNLMDDALSRSMLQRQDVLTASMTAASSAPWQKNTLAALGAQFMTYHIRMVEQLFTNKVLTGAERIRLGVGQIFLYGAAGIPGAGYIMDRMEYEQPELAEATNPELWDIARFGMVDGLLDWTLGEETAVSASLAAGEGLFEFFRNLGNTGVVEVGVGPGGSITYDIFSSATSLLKNVFRGEFEYISYDWNKFARNFAGYNSAYTLWVAGRTREYLSRKSESPLMTDMTFEQVLLKSFGIPLEQERDTWEAYQNINRDEERLKEHIKEITRSKRIFDDYVASGDHQRAIEVGKDIGAMLEILRPYERNKVMGILGKDSTFMESLVKNLLEQGRTAAANRLLEYSK